MVVLTPAEEAEAKQNSFSAALRLHPTLCSRPFAETHGFLTYRPATRGDLNRDIAVVNTAKLLELCEAFTP